MDQRKYIFSTRDLLMMAALAAVGVSTARAPGERVERLDMT
jgi:hypothetical protein